MTTDDVIGKLPDKDKDIIFLAACFFWLKWHRRNVQQDGFELSPLELDENDPPFLQILKAAFQIERQKKSDVDGDVVVGVTDLIVNHSMKATLFSTLTEVEIRRVCSSLEAIFENQEYCVFLEDRSYYDTPTSVEDFAFGTASTMLWLCDGIARLSWFQDIYRGDVRNWIVEKVFEHKVAGAGGKEKLLGLLPSKTK